MGKVTEEQTIIAAVALAFDMTVDELTGPQRDAPVMRARQAACWMLHVMPRADGRRRSYPAVARAMRRDHSTVIGNCRQAETYMQRDAAYVSRIGNAGANLAAMTFDYTPQRVRVTRFRHCKVKNEPAAGDRDGMMRLRGSFALQRAIEAAVVAGQAGHG